jgi:hypothetical protein
MDLRASAGVTIILVFLSSFLLITLYLPIETISASPDTVTNSPSSTSGGWTNPTNAYANDGGYASVTSGTPSASQTYGGYGFNIPSGSTITQVRVRYDAWCVPLGISYVGNTSATGNNPTSGNFTLPSGWQAGDVAIFWWYTYAGTKTYTPPTNVTLKENNAPTNYGRLYIGYRTLQSGDSTFAWTSSSVTNSTTIWGVSVFRNVYNVGDPFENDSGAPATFTNVNDPNPPAVTTLTDNAWVYCVFGKRNDYTSITAPSGYTSAGSNSSTSGSDASAGTAYKEKTPAGSEDPGAWTLGGGATGDDGQVWTGALKPDVSSDEQIRVDVSWDGETSWSSKQTTNLNGAETTYWYDITGVTSWTPEKLNDTNFRTRVDAYTVGGASEVRLDWIPVEVNYTPPPVYPTQPTLYIPSDGTVTNDNTPTFEWTKGENADNHNLLVDNDSDFSSSEENQVLITENIYTVTTPLADDNYSWKVIAVNENGENESAVWTFVIDTTPPPFRPFTLLRMGH